jgi:hypothetical protein
VIVGANGFVNFNGVLPGDATFTVNVTTGLSKGSSGEPGSTPTNAIMDLNSVNVQAVGPGILTIMLTDTGFTDLGLGGSLEVHIGGTLPTAGSLSATTFKSSSNLEFDTSGFAGPTQSFSAPPLSFSGDATKSHGLLGTYSMTQVVNVNFTTPSSASFDYKSTNTITPEPSTMALAGLGALGLIGYGLRRRKARGA